MNYYIGDLHLFNRNQTDEGRNYDRRPFATVEEMNQYILERWNAKINNGDTVYILGDMAMRGKNSALLALVAQLKGKKILFRGNHDDLSDYRYQRLFEEITDYREIADSFDGKTYKLCLMHYPILMWNGQHRGSILLYAHTHNTVEEALQVMGEEYRKALAHGMESGWIDVYENKGKRGGAYSWGSYGVHPFVLLNHNDTINSMFTLAHEMGHALHSFFTWKKQPYLYADHKIFVAEVASTCNEALLMEHLLKTTEDKTMRKYLINYFLEQFRGTLFRQTMFAEFEKITHAMAEKGEPLTWEGMNQIYRDLNIKYFGEDIVIDSEIDIEWARIPHFYNAFYVYQYATGYSAAIALSRKILNEGQPAVAAYLDFLSKGDSEYSIDLLKGAGVDMTTAAPIENAMQLFKELLDEFETL